MIDLATFAEYLECYSVNGIQFPDGAVHCLRVTLAGKGWDEYTVEAGAQTTLQQLETAGAMSGNSCAVMAQLTDAATGFHIMAGECNWGSDGFVAVLDGRTRRLMWLAWFDCSNPFHALTLHDGALQATSTSGCTWTFPLHAPANCFVRC